MVPSSAEVPSSASTSSASKALSPASHALSLSLSSSLPSPGSIAHAHSISSPSPGLVSLVLDLPARSPYSFQRYPISIGGPGVGNDLDAAFGGPPRRPVQVRFDNALVSVADVDGQQCVDDTGAVLGARFWSLLPGSSPTVPQIVAALVKIMCAPSDPAEAAAFEAGVAFTRAKHDAVADFRKLHPGNPLLEPAAYVDPDSLAPELAAFLSSPSPSIPPFITSPSPGVYRFPLFPPSLCASLLSTVDAYEATDLPKRRPNTMNNHGLVLTEIGLLPYATSLLRTVIGPLARVLFEGEAFAGSLDCHHTFSVEYRAEELGNGDRNLDMHHDSSEVTLNVCLGRSGFAASGLRFCGEFGAADHRRSRGTVAHEVGTAVMHLGRQRHGADDIAKGERVNLIAWARSSSFRAAAAFGHMAPDGYPKEREGGEVDQACLSRANDADYEEKVKRGDRAQAQAEKKRRFVPFDAPGGKSCNR